MRNHLIYLLFVTDLFSCNSSNQFEHSKSFFDKQKYAASRDSILFENDFGSIYYSKDTSSKVYNYFQPNTDSLILKSYCDSLRNLIFLNGKMKIDHFNNELVNSTWTDLHQFNGSFCLYSPSDWMAYEPIHLTDSSIQFASSDPSVEVIIDFKKNNSTSFSFVTLNIYLEKKSVCINIIDSIKGISIWEWRDLKNNLISKEYKVLTKNVKLFPIIIEDCGNQKCVFENQNYFEKPTFN